ncbi:hypothetical protein JG687_00017970 [Phytophthora cactorum]|uniref:Uncharacterized protein n=1 Tax=Phytophthora cactorum TaxID=29920 RepID=A0A329SA31_9STRA|nr:hypothetical protein Pcac1_g19563 [Phytophthora cactorum]KAG2795823.1 hypothetical protein PC111_g21981 [Phytophthora cactorum]KAG2796162.1 hypothetical protein PC112_g22320 [Phytophthora cactorum]KAG2823154.1 hypothetical protein PC113_g22224 [Phytophthora cactorum]KAG2875174.1 hypothetical protein PC114_g24880 [Phytophthora cactorum]
MDLELILQVAVLLVPTGFAKTNNHVEQFNKVIKRDGTLRVSMNQCALLKKVISLSHHRSVLHPNFATKPKLATTLLARARRHLKAKKIVVSQYRHSIQFLLEGASGRPSGFHRRSLIDPQENAKNAEEGERNNRHMERLEQPMIGWTANQYWDLSM